MRNSGRRPVRLTAVLVMAAALSAAGPAGAARIVIVNTDDPGEGFNDPTPVAPVIGNPANTLGGQRLRVFEAAAWRLGSRIASPVEIRVTAGWDSLECTAMSGTLASAGPSFVYRDFPAAPRRSTWYAAALADSLAREELGSDDDDEMSITFNADVGTAGCLSSRKWDYRIGVSGSTGFNMERVLVHEMGHGINFTTFVDQETGEKFQGFDDAYMLHLEDHTSGKLWRSMSNAQRLASSTRTGDLHWLGGNALVNAVRLRGGTHAASGHPQMYAPRPREEGSSVSHWDTGMSLNVDDFMEPFSTRTSADLLTQHLFQDLGWSVKNGNGSVEVAVLQVTASTAGHEVVLLDTSSGQTVRRMPLPAGYSALDLTVLPHHSGPPASEIAVLLWRPRGSQVLVVRAGTGARVWIKDAVTGAIHGRLVFPRPERPVDVAVLESFAGTNAPEIAVLLAVPKQGRSEIQVRDGS